MGENGFWLPEASTTLAGEVDALFWFVFWVSTVIFAAVVLAKLYFVVKYRRRSEKDVTTPVHESKALEAIWIVVPTILVLIVFTWGFDLFVQLNSAPPDSYQITVRGKQWTWEYEYAEGVLTAGDLYVPVGRPVKLNMSSADVLHSFFVPEFRIKQDVLPNRYTSVWFKAENVGEHTIYCTEYCGTAHSGMLGKVVVVSEEDFAAWIQEQNQDLPPTELGQQVYKTQCAVCHAIDGSRKIGPPLNVFYGTERVFSDGSSTTADDSYIRNSILNPSSQVVEGYAPAMPPFSALSAQQVDGLVAYIKSLE
ncbi:MAG: cytochrome c oxidase subunit II [Bacteroidetes bacterium CG12_big_fil_rev_8_21_14_0_65_60_17]|nr:MAG: cytochrome c oxidase subunit II [Bacteroidetes bacterium CG12_big_fil_rev_8_21_14_0_65_60_17]